MPTLRSLGVHPDLCHRLVTESTDSSSGYNAISTPQALLSRNPDQLRLLLSRDTDESRSIPLPQAEELRSQIATAMIQNSKTGLHIQQQRRRNSPNEDPAGDQTSNDATPSLLTALDLLHPTAPPLSTGMPSLDRMLDGSAPGVPPGTLTQLSGPPGVGKTRFAIGLAQRAVAANFGCWYMYSGALPVDDLLVGNNRTASTTTTPVQIRGPTSSPHQLLVYLAELEEELLKPTSITIGTVLIIDSCSGCCAPTVPSTDHTTATASIHAPIQSHVVLTLKRLTRLFHLTTLLVNGTVADGTKPALGTVWNATMPDTAMWMTEEQFMVTRRHAGTTPLVLARPQR